MNMNWQDLINGTFQSFGGFFTAVNIDRLLRDKQVHGVSWVAMLYFTTWSLWKLFFYFDILHWVSFAGAGFNAVMCVVYVTLLIYYSRKKL